MGDKKIRNWISGTIFAYPTWPEGFFQDSAFFTHLENVPRGTLYGKHEWILMTRRNVPRGTSMLQTFSFFPNRGLHGSFHLQVNLFSFFKVFPRDHGSFPENKMDP